MKTSNPSVFVMVVAEIIGIAVSVGIGVLLQLALGGRYRKSKSKELRSGAGFIAFMPVWGALFVYLLFTYFANARPVVLWLFMMGCVCVFWMWTQVCEKFIPAKVSWWIGGVIWSVTLWLVWTDRWI
jgi:hypothetical protein